MINMLRFSYILCFGLLLNPTLPPQVLMTPVLLLDLWKVTLPFFTCFEVSKRSLVKIVA